jgi:molybdopterin molybdotransferase
MSNLVTAEKALEIILQSIKPVGKEAVPLGTSFRRVIADDLVAQEDIPPFDNSGMDGFAVRSADTLTAEDNAPVTFPIAGEIPAGQIYTQALQSQTALRIMTGAPIPDGADAVIEQELVAVVDGNIVVRRAVEPRRNVRERGLDVRKGTIVFRKGTRLGPAHVGVLASLGIESIPVYASPTVALLVTGNELVDGRTLRPGFIRNSNSVFLKALIQNSTCTVNDLGVAGDNVAEIHERMAQGLESNAVVTTGGVSVGKYDLVLEVWKKLGIQMLFWKVNIKPGMPLAFGVFRKGEKTTAVFALPGNPVSCYVTFLQFVLPALRAMQGEEHASALRLPAILEQDIPKSDSKRHWVRGIVRREKGTLYARATGVQSSAMLTSLAAANCLIIIPEEKRNPKAGETLEVELLME